MSERGRASEREGVRGPVVRGKAATVHTEVQIIIKSEGEDTRRQYGRHGIRLHEKQTHRHA